MSKSKLLVGTDFSPNSVPALEVAIQWAKKLDAEAELVHVSPLYDTFLGITTMNDILSDNEKMEQSIHKELDEFAKKHSDGSKVETKVLFGRPIDAFNKRIKEARPDVVVMGMKGHSGLESLIVGSVAEGIVRHAERPTLLVKDVKVKSPKTIAFATDLSDASSGGFEWTKKLAKAFGAKVRLIHIVEPDTVFNDFGKGLKEHKVQSIEDILTNAREEGIKRVQKQVDELKAIGVETEVFIETTTEINPAKHILDYLEDHPSDLFIMGTHGRAGFTKWLMGSVAEVILRRINTSMLVVKNS